MDLHKIVGTGPGRRITKEDVLAYTGNPPPVEQEQSLAPQHPDEEIIAITGIRKVTFENISKSVATAAQVTSTTEVDLTELIRLRQEILAGWERYHGVRPTLNAFFVKAVALALREHPLLNSSVQGDRLVLKKYYHIGLAVTVGEDLVVPVVRHADSLSVLEIAKRIAVLVEKARQNALTPEDMSGGTFTISNVGPYQVQVFTPVIVQPQNAILGIGATTQRPVVRDGQIVIRDVANLCLTYDHRVIQGASAARFRITLKDLLEHPLSLLG
ncbi:hypothetical protein SY88_15575 [Clostridiales bacterium PH28_bin88]|nr:hypothetical protein SY88_15575 [Clostridiales bacterium PH28_bin88]